MKHIPFLLLVFVFSSCRTERCLVENHQSIVKSEVPKNIMDSVVIYFKYKSELFLGNSKFKRKFDYQEIFNKTKVIGKISSNLIKKDFYILSDTSFEPNIIVVAYQCKNEIKDLEEFFTTKDGNLFNDKFEAELNELLEGRQFTEQDLLLLTVQLLDCRFIYTDGLEYEVLNNHDNLSEISKTLNIYNLSCPQTHEDKKWVSVSLNLLAWSSYVYNVAVSLNKEDNNKVTFTTKLIGKIGEGYIRI